MGPNPGAIWDEAEGKMTEQAVYVVLHGFKYVFVRLQDGQEEIAAHHNRSYEAIDPLRFSGDGEESNRLD